MEIVSSGGWMAVAGLIIYMFLNLEKKVEKLQTNLESIANSLNQKKDREECSEELKVITAKVDDLAVETVTREEHYRDISGWRSEIRNLNDKIDDLMLRKADAS